MRRSKAPSDGHLRHRAPRIAPRAAFAHLRGVLRVTLLGLAFVLLSILMVWYGGLDAPHTLRRPSGAQD